MLLSNEHKAHIWLVVVTLIWGVTFPLIRDALSQIDAHTFVFYRFLIALCSFGVILIFKRPKQWSKESVAWGVFLGILAGISYLTQSVGLQTVESGRAAFITGMNVVMVPFLAPLFKVGKLTAIDVGAALIALLGLYFLADPSAKGISLGDLWVLTCAIDYAFYVVMIQVYSKKKTFDSTTLAFLQIVGVFLVGTFSIPLAHKPFVHSTSVWTALLYCGTIASILPIWIQSKYQKDTTAQATALIFSLEPVFAAICGFFILHERMSMKGIFGAALILAAIAGSEWIKARKLQT